MYVNTISNVARKGENKQDNIFYSIIILSIFLIKSVIHCDDQVLFYIQINLL